MSIALRLLREMRSSGMDSGFDDSGADDSGYEDSGYDDSGAGGNWRTRRAANLRERAGNVEQRGQGGRRNTPEAQLARTVENKLVESQAKLAMNKSKYRLFRSIPLVAPQSVAIAGTVNINVTPTTKCFAMNMTASGNFTINSLVIMGQTIVPNGAVDSRMFENVSTYNTPLNMELDTVPITGQILNSTGVAAICSLSMFVWMEDSAASERF